MKDFLVASWPNQTNKKTTIRKQIIVIRKIKQKNKIDR